MTAGEFTARVAACGLGRDDRPLWADPLEPDVWRQMLVRVREQRLVGLLQFAVEAGAAPVTEEQASEVAEHHLVAMSTVLWLERLLLEVVAEFCKAGIAYRVLKGAGAAYLDYADPSQRMFGDIDLLVMPEQFDDAVGVLHELGDVRRTPKFRAGFDRRFGKGATFLDASEKQLDLHRTFVTGPYGVTARLDDVWAGEATFVVGGRKIAVPTDEIRFVSTCLHMLADEPPRLVLVRDLAEMLLAGRIEADEILRLASTWRVEAAVARGIRAISELLRLEEHHSLQRWAHDHAPNRWEQRVLPLYLGGATYAASSLAALRTIPGFANKVTFTAALVVPSREYLASQDTGYVGWWWRGVRGVRRTGSVG